MRIYVAGKWGSTTIPRVRAVQTTLIAAGHTITYDWTVDEVETSGPQQAMRDKMGVLTADVFVLVAEDPSVVYCGALVELGMAIASGIPIYIIGECLKESRTDAEGRKIQGSCIFTKLPEIQFGDAIFTHDLLHGGLGVEHVR